MSNMNLTPLQLAKFWGQVDVGLDCECWPWRGRSNAGGYGRHDAAMAHRVAYTLVNGEIPDGMIIRHNCDNPPCCNPKHLLVGTHADNMQDCISRKRIAHGAKQHKTSITAEDALYIRKNPDRMTGRALAAKFGLSPSTISYIRSGKTWRYAGL